MTYITLMHFFSLLEFIQDKCPTRPGSSPASSTSDIGSSLDSTEIQARKTSTDADWILEGKEDQEPLVQPEFKGLWDRKHRNLMVMIKL